MGANTKNLLMLKTHIDSINICFMNDFVYGNMLWAFTSLRAFLCNYVLYSLGLILRYIFRFHVGDTKNQLPVAPLRFEDSEIDGFTEEVADLLFQNSEYAHETGEEKEGESESSVLIETDTNKRGGETDCSALEETGSDIDKDGKKREGETEGYVFEDAKKIDENETESSVFIEDDSSDHQYGTKREEKEEDTEGHVLMESVSPITTSKCQFGSGKDIKGFIEEPTALSFSFREFFTRPNVSAVSDNSFANTGFVSEKKISELKSEGVLVAREEKELVQEQRTFTSKTDYVFGGSDSSDEDYFLFNDNSFSSDSDSESSSSSGIIWDNINKTYDSITCQKILASNNSCEVFESEILKVIKEERVENVKEPQFSCDRNVPGFRIHSNYDEDDEYIELDLEMKQHGSDHGEETVWEVELGESDSDEEDEDDFEWGHDELVEQLKLELRNARQGGLATILEAEEEAEETESPKVVEDVKPLKIDEEKHEYKDQINEILKVYKNYADKMRKLDILNYQTMHAIGILQLKGPLTLISTPKSTIPAGAKPLISQNFWLRKASKNISDPLLKCVHELHRDLELVYVGQVCLSWEILCWQHMKAQELKQYDSQGSYHQYNIVAGEFQNFQVLMRRFIENEPFQGLRIQSYVKNRCVIRNLLQVPAIKDDRMKDKNVNKGDEEDAIASGRLMDIIKDSMRMFWEFVRADKDYGNVKLKFSQQIGTKDLKDPVISDLLVDIRTQLHKKERKLKDIVRSGNCIVRKFQKHHEDQLDHDQLLAQVGLRLISRVINMSKLRKDQLIWCNEKLKRIKFVRRKIQMEPSFLLFPC